MSQHRLLLSAGPRQLERLSVNDFLWRPPPEQASFHTDLGPRAEGLGPVPDLNADLIRLAALVYLTDRTVLRGTRGWERELELTIPVSDPSAWEAQAEDLQAELDFLSSDIWTFRFEKRQLPRRRQLAPVEGEGPVCLFSGGADSLGGALVVAHELGRPPVLVSHWDATTISGVQRQLVADLGKLWGAEPAHLAVRIGRQRRQLGSNAEFSQEPSSRTRSLLFIALGLAAAAVRDSELLMPENGYTSLNVPLAGERRGALSTRTTHPAFLDALTTTLENVGLSARLRNPFERMTKGQVFRRVADIHGDQTAGELLSRSHSCAKPGAQYVGLSPAAQCGVCFGCLVRRGAFLAADLTDGTPYVETQLRGDGRRPGWLDPKRQHYETVRYAVQRGVAPADVLALGLPPRIAPRDALDLARAGLAELAAVQVP
ncbi:MAG: hypothetical protein ACLP0J_08805 [Solirubrobacteraceae bacterium]